MSTIYERVAGHYLVELRVGIDGKGTRLVIQPVQRGIGCDAVAQAVNLLDEVAHVPAATPCCESVAPDRIVAELAVDEVHALKG